MYDRHSALLTFDRPKAIVQIFTNHLDISKSQWRGRAWRRHAVWNEEVTSVSGWAEGDRVVLNEIILERREELISCDMILLIDANNIPHPSSQRHPPREAASMLDREGGVGRMRPSPYIFSKWPGMPQPYGPYDLVPADDAVELHLDGSRRALLGPRWGNFKVADLRLAMPLRTIVSGRVAADEQSLYRYQEDLFIYLGSFDRCEIRSENRITMRKKVPYEAAKVIDLQKDLF